MTQRIVVLILGLLFFQSVYSQVFTMLDMTGASCNGVFYDSGGAGDGYLPSENLVYTHCSDIGAFSPEFYFSSFDLASTDTLYIYDGNTTLSPLIGAYSNQDLTGQTILGSSGCLTFQFISDPFSLTDLGFRALISCDGCQEIEPKASVNLPLNASNSNILEICEGQTVNFQSETLYPENNTTYTQNDQINTLVWDLASTSFTGEQGSFNYDIPGIFPVYLTVLDTVGCKSRKQLLTIRVSGTPDFNVIPPINGVCLNDTFSLVAKPNEDTITPVPSSVSDPIFLDDVQGVTFSSAYQVEDFIAGQTISSISDLTNICIEMEHSYVGDLEISLTCPNGQSVYLHQLTGAGTFLGEPIDNDNSNPTAGIGYEYCFNMSASQTWEDYIDAFNPLALPEQEYLPVQSFSNLIGCPLNGEWSISVNDNLPLDNGFIFSLQLNFDPSLYPIDSVYPVAIQDTWWESGGQLLANGDSVAVILNQSGTQDIRYVIQDVFGCQWDTVFQVNVNPLPSVYYAYTPQCIDQQPLQVLDASISPNGAIVNQNWLIGGQSYTGNALSHTVNNPGTHSVTLIAEDQLGCMNDSTFFISVLDLPKANFSNSLGCISDGIVFFDQSLIYGTDSISQFLWNLGDGSQQMTNIGTYGPHFYPAVNSYTANLEVTTLAGCKDDTSIVVNIYEQPVALFSLDTNEGCIPFCTQVTNSSFSPTDAIVLNEFIFGNGGGIAEQNPAICYNQSGEYIIDLIAHNSFGCTDTFSLNVYPRPLPEPEFIFDPILPTSLNPEVHFIDQSAESKNWSWSIDGEDFSTDQNPTYVFPKSGEYLVNFTIQNRFNCVDSIQRVVVVDSFYTVFIPNAFTPNDDPFNPLYTIFTTGISDDNFEFSIFDRWGKRVFMSDKTTFSWDGKNQNGQEYPQGLYVYKFVGYDVFGAKHKKAGEIFLVR